MARKILSLTCLLALAACAGGGSSDPERALAPASSAFLLPAEDAEPQRPGDPERGRELLLNNGTPEAPYLSCGIPRTLWNLPGVSLFLPQGATIPDRKDSDLPYWMSSAKRPSGLDVINTNCLLCHGGQIGADPTPLIGMPNPNRDFTNLGWFGGGVSSAALGALSLFVSKEEGDELQRMRRVLVAQQAFPAPDTVGMNAADMLFGVLAAHRDPITLSWRDEARNTLKAEDSVGVFVDAPPWWHLHRKPTMFYSGFGRGDHARILMTASLLCLEDSDEAAQIDAYFPDIQAYLLSLRAPKYEERVGPIDQERADRGREHFTARCEGCHGGKDGEGPEPRTFVPLSQVGTDPFYARLTTENEARTGAYAFDVLFDFFNSSWYGTQSPAGRLERQPELGYVPPPLDGIWATAPYFHNGSVPTLDAVLNPELRPGVFKRSFDPASYDFGERVGWPYQEVAFKGLDKNVYDTNKDGYHNTGHSFAASMSDDERRDLLEYLKTF
ncbi:MAG: hypothetical protein JWN04_1872 [Myxococcaceae bacterium]|nr:hypothetical protein [Myxococcaceae bacterium]